MEEVDAAAPGRRGSNVESPKLNDQAGTLVVISKVYGVVCMRQGSRGDLQVVGAELAGGEVSEEVTSIAALPLGSCRRRRLVKVVVSDRARRARRLGESSSRASLPDHVGDQSGRKTLASAREARSEKRTQSSPSGARLPSPCQCHRRRTWRKAGQQGELKPQRGERRTRGRERSRGSEGPC